MTPAVQGPTPLAALDPDGPEVVLGGADPFDPDIRPEPTSLFGPRSARLLGPQGPLLVADTGHHRVVVHHRLPTEDRAPADLVLGQPDFQTEGRNARGDDAGPSTMNVPTGVCAFGEGIAVADSWNNRVLIWKELPRRSSQPADLVLGQADFVGQRPNRDRADPGPDTMHWPFQVLTHDGRLYVADAGNRRVLVWRDLPQQSGQPADFALGQPDLTCRSDNGGSEPGPSSLRWPHDLTVCEGRLAVADAGNNRVLVWPDLPDAFDAPAAQVLGQVDFRITDHNRGQYWPTHQSLNMPYAASAWRHGILVADTANSRLVGYDAQGSRFADGAARLTAQPHFGAKGDNRNKLPVRDSLCWPYGLQVFDDLAIVSDTGNHRVVLWKVSDAR